MQSRLAAHNPQQLHPPLNGSQMQRLCTAIEGLSARQLSWASGYLAGISEGQHSGQPVPQRERLTVLYASQTGNARAVAETLADSIGALGLDARILSVADYKPREIAREKTLFLVTSTQGEGEPPESALGFFRFLHGPRAPRLGNLRFAVFGLGDSSYQQFCQAARDFDQRLAALGGQRLLPRMEADLDFQTETRQWITRVLERVESEIEAPAAHANVIPLTEPRPVARHDRNNPFVSTLLENRRITTDSALSEVRHLALEIDPSLVNYAPGDALGVWARNDPALVNGVLAATGLEGGSQITLDGGQIGLAEALTEKLELARLHPEVAVRWADLAETADMSGLVSDKSTLRGYSTQRQLIDLLTEFPARPDPQAFANLLQPLQPRLYSIASSQAEFEDEIHLTVSLVRYRAHGRDHLGAASGYLGTRLAEGGTLGAYVVENPDFRLPRSGDTPIIMIGAGTGIAPYRGFLQQRAAQGDRGRNWLLFGNRHFHRDFLYQLEWLSHRRSGLLDRATPAFSRDGGRRAYVQDRLLEEGREIYRWIEDGAIIYVCGGAPMESGVRDALTRIAQAHGGLNGEQAGEYIENLRSDGRYKRDVY